MTVSPKVSVLLTSYNHAKYLHESIESVLNQTYKNFELIIWDDASTDNSWNIISSYTDERIRSFKNETNQFIEYFRKAISDVVEGEYIAIHHSDDVWEPQKLEKQVVFLDENPQVGAVFSNALVIREDGKPFEDMSHFYYKIFDQPNRTRYEWLNYFFYHGNALCHPSVLIRKVCYDECGLYRYGLAQLPDYDMWVRLCLKHEIHVMPEKLVRFRVRADDSNSSGNRLDAQIRGQFEFLQLLDNYKNVPSIQELIKIFPNAEKYLKPEGYNLGFALAMVALESNTYQVTELFGLNILFEILNDPNSAKEIKELYNFSYHDFFVFTGKYDVFSAELMLTFAQQIAEKEEVVQSLKEKVAEREQAIKLLDEKVAEHQRDLAEIRSSKAWKILILLRRIRVVVFPFEEIKKRKRSNRLKKEEALIRPSGLFDETWYLSNNADIINSKIDPLHHYLLFGGFERRDPSPHFNSGWYLDTYNDVKKAGINPLVHYLEFGKEEGRTAKPAQPVQMASEFQISSGTIDLAQNTRVYETAVVLHLFYEDLFYEIKEYLQNLKDFDLYISMPYSNRGFTDQIFASFPNAKIYLTENRGRDVLPFISIYQNISLLNYKYLLKIHTKKSFHRDDGGAWRTDIYRKLIGSTEVVHSILSAFENDPTIGIIGPKGHVIDYRTYTWITNRLKPEELARKVGIYIKEDHPYSFVAGLMFWAKPKSLQYLTLLPIEPEDFEPEPLEPDGALVHALERFTGLVAEEIGYSICESDELGKISEPRRGSPSASYPFGVSIPKGRRYRLSMFVRKMRLRGFPIGSRREMMAKILVEAIRNPRNPNLPKKIEQLFALITPEQLSKKLLECLASNEYVISLSHDDYTRIVGGVQLVVNDEQVTYNERGIDYLHIYPFITNPRLLRNHESFVIGINCNGKSIGALNSGDFLAVLKRLKSKRLLNVLIHHTLGFEISFIYRILNELGNKRGRFWLHDNFSICPGYTLLRNDLVYCDAPDVNSNTCVTCKYGNARRLQQPVFRKFFENNLLEVVAPSQFTLDLWKQKSSFAIISEKVVPHIDLNWKGILPSRQPNHPIRIGFLGYPVYWKGWETWMRLVGNFSGDSRYQFYCFTSRSKVSDKMKRVSVSVSKNDRFSMVKALRDHKIDVAFLWSLCPETFSFTLYESLAAGCYVLTYKDSGNIQAYLNQNKNRGLVLNDEQALFELLSGDDLNSMVMDYQKNGRPQAEFSFLPEFD